MVTSIRATVFLHIFLEHESFDVLKISSYVIKQLQAQINAENQNFNNGEVGKTTLPEIQVNNSYNWWLDGSDIKSAICTLNKTVFNGQKQNMSQHAVWKHIMEVKGTFLVTVSFFVHARQHSRLWVVLHAVTLLSPPLYLLPSSNSFIFLNTLKVFHKFLNIFKIPFRKKKFRLYREIVVISITRNILACNTECCWKNISKFYENFAIFWNR